MEIQHSRRGEVVELRMQGRFDAAWSAFVANAIDEVVRAGTTPAAIWRASVCSRSLSQPWSNLPFHFAIHSCGTWCGAWVAPGAK